MNELIYWYDEFVTQQPFVLKLTMPTPDSEGPSYSDKLGAEAIKELLTT